MLPKHAQDKHRNPPTKRCVLFLPAPAARSVCRQGLMVGPIRGVVLRKTHFFFLSHFPYVCPDLALVLNDCCSIKWRKRDVCVFRTWGGRVWVLCEKDQNLEVG
jgi:hypothetical protein